jgi:hypothetical protein
MDIQCAYIHTRNSKVIGLRPATQEYSTAIVASGDYDVVLRNLVQAGWEPVNRNFRPALAGDSLVLLRRVNYSEPQFPDSLRVDEVEADADLSDEEIEAIRHNRWDLQRMVDKDGKGKVIIMVFTKLSAGKGGHLTADGIFEDHRELRRPNTALTSATFGQISNTRAQLPVCELQLTLNLVF